jgi:hypothetical protein
MWCDLRRGAGMKRNFSRFGKKMLRNFCLWVDRGFSLGVDVVAVVA